MGNTFSQSENVNIIHMSSDVVFLTKSKTKQSEKERSFLLCKKKDIVRKETICFNLLFIFRNNILSNLDNLVLQSKTCISVGFPPEIFVFPSFSLRENLVFASQKLRKT